MEITSESMIRYTSNVVGKDTIYQVESNINVEDKTVMSIDSGSVNTLSTGTQVATFNRYSTNGLNINFNDGTALERQAILEVVEGYIAAVETKYKSNVV